MTPEQRARLPKFAQREMAFLERRVRELESQLDDLAVEATEETEMSYGFGIGDLKSRVIPHGPVRFRFAGDALSVSIVGDANVRNPYNQPCLRVSSENGVIAVIPSATNSVHIKPMGR